jgi:hypothetical protein
MPLSYNWCRRLCREAERCEPILHAMEAYEEAYGHPSSVRRALFVEGGPMPFCFARKTQGKVPMEAQAKPG